MLNTSSSAAELAALVSATWVCASFETYTDPCGPNRSDEAASSAADDNLLESKLAQTNVALTGPTRQQVLQLMMTYYKCF